VKQNIKMEKIMTVPTDNHGCCNCPGPQGPAGVQGQQGQQGIAGHAGPAGAVGPQGKMGPAGPVGQMGLPGPQGSIGPMGPAGPQGLTGADGAAGVPGAAGPQGPAGIAGPQGVQGLQGVPGKDCDNSLIGVYLNLFSESNQQLVPNGAGVDYAVFQKTGVLSSALDFDISLAATLGQVKFLKAGVYTVAWDANGQLTPPFPNPVPAWAMGFYLNGVFLPGSGIAGFNSSPDDLATCLTSVQNVTIAAGDVLTLRNISKFAISLVSSVPSLVVAATCASFSAIKIG
jgi:collagen triple helix repeat protein